MDAVNDTIFTSDYRGCKCNKSENSTGYLLNASKMDMKMKMHLFFFWSRVSCVYGGCNCSTPRRNVFDPGFESFDYSRPKWIVIVLLCRTCDDPNERWVKERPPIVIHASRPHLRNRGVHSTQFFYRDYTLNLGKAADSSGVWTIVKYWDSKRYLVNSSDIGLNTHFL